MKPEKFIFSLTTVGLFLILQLTSSTLQGQQIWTGSMITFTKASLADHMLSANRDSISPFVCIARGASSNLFNFFEQEDPSDPNTPIGTEWAVGRAKDWQNLEFSNHKAIVKKCEGRRKIIGKELTLHLIKEDIYLNFKFLSWERGADGGGYSYERSTKSEL